MKLSQGEYVAVENVEMTYGKSPVVGQLWVYGNSFKSTLLGVVVPTAEPTAAWLQSKGWWPNSAAGSTKLTSDTFIADYQKAMQNPAHQAEIKAWVFAQLKEQEKPLTSFSRLKDIIVESRIDKIGMAFNEANDCLTPTFKVSGSSTSGCRESLPAHFLTRAPSLFVVCLPDAPPAAAGSLHQGAQGAVRRQRRAG